MCKFCNEFREMDYMSHMQGGFGFGGMGRYHDPDGFDYDPGEDMMTNGLEIDSAKFKQNNEETKALPQAKPEKKKTKKIRRRPSSRLAKYGIKRKGEKKSNASKGNSGLASTNKDTSDHVGSRSSKNVSD
eukprot:jgi/Bigna1/75343/fgenesh1_pg.34_\